MAVFGVIDPLYSLSGLAVGALVGMTGVGGGSLMTPLLVLLFGIHPATAVGTDLLYAAITKTGGTLVHGASRTVDWRITRRLAIGSVPAAIVTLTVANHFGLLGQHSGSALITTVLGVALILTAVALVFRTKLLALAARRVPDLDPSRAAALTVATGIVLGILVSLSSVGAGAIGMTALVFLYPKMSTARLVGSDLAHAVPLTLVAGLAHWLFGSVDWVPACLLAGRLPAGHRARQLRLGPCARGRAPADACGDVAAGRRQAGVLKRPPRRSPLVTSQLMSEPRIRSADQEGLI
ncbi:MAG: sulfite exporter TauE/SafE family protein [Aliidongia sp.]